MEKRRIPFVLALVTTAVIFLLIGISIPILLQIAWNERFPVREVRLRRDIDIAKYNCEYYKSENHPEPTAQGIIKKGSILKRQNVKAPCAWLDLTIAVHKTDIEDVE
jgi:hypothetical protein